MLSLGIDLGTTFSVIAYVDENGEAKVIPNREGKTLTPSVVYFGEGSPVVGEEAKDCQKTGSSEIAAFFKRLMGDEFYTLQFGEDEYDTIALSSLVLQKLKQDAEAYLGEQVTDAVITVPAYFNNVQREATLEAGKRAGFHVLKVINEPTAAAIAYGFRKGTGNRNILVYDLGGGTFDVTVAKYDEVSIQVLATDGDYNLGGKDFDDRLVMYVCEQFQGQFGLDPLEDVGTMNEILVAAEQAKVRLTSLRKTTISVLYGGHKATYDVTQELFEDISIDLLERTWNLAEDAVASARLGWDHIHDVILVGGSTRMPMVAKFIEKKTGRLPHMRINADEVVAVGAAIQASILKAEQEQAKLRFALGAVKRVEDVMSHSLGMVAVNEDYTRYINSVIIPKNKKIPLTEKKSYKIKTSPFTDNVLEVYVTQGESDVPLDCVILGKYVLTGISHTDIQPAFVEVTYSYDRNGVVQVAATEKSTGQALSVHVEHSLGDLEWLAEPPQPEESAGQNISVAIAIDTSGSMQKAPIREAVKAARKFVNDMDLNRFSVGLIAFADRARTIQQLTDDGHELERRILELPSYADHGTLGFGTDGQPLTEARTLFRSQEQPRFLIILTDGLWGNESEAIRLAQQCHQDGIEIIAIGFGAANEEFLNRMATSDANALFTDVKQLVQSFSKIAQVIQEKAMAYTPKKF